MNIVFYRDINQFLEKSGYDVKERDFVEGEFEVYFNLAKLFDIESFLEVGVYTGLSACSVMAGSSKLKRYFGFDAQKYIQNSNEIAKERIIKFIEANSDIFPHLRNIEWEIFDVNTFDEKFICSILGDKKFDWIHIDAGHSEEEAYHDIVFFWNYVKKYMTVHDIFSINEVYNAIFKVMNNRVLKELKSNIVVNSSAQGFLLLAK